MTVPSAGPIASLKKAAQARRDARRILLKRAQEIHETDQAANALHARDARWVDCYDCACLFLDDVRAALSLPRYPTPSTDGRPS